MTAVRQAAPTMLAAPAKGTTAVPGSPPKRPPRSGTPGAEPEHSHQLWCLLHTPKLHFCFPRFTNWSSNGMAQVHSPGAAAPWVQGWALPPGHPARSEELLQGGTWAHSRRPGWKCRPVHRSSLLGLHAPGVCPPRLAVPIGKSAPSGAVPQPHLRLPAAEPQPSRRQVPRACRSS